MEGQRKNGFIVFGENLDAKLSQRRKWIVKSVTLNMLVIFSWRWLWWGSLWFTISWQWNSDAGSVMLVWWSSAPSSTTIDSAYATFVGKASGDLTRQSVFNAGAYWPEIRFGFVDRRHWSGWCWSSVSVAFKALKYGDTRTRCENSIWFDPTLTPLPSSDEHFWFCSDSLTHYCNDTVLV